MNLQLRGKAALVTGGNRGIGREIALTLASEGLDVAVSGRVRAQLDEVVDEIRAHGVRGLALAGDLTDPAVCRRVVDDAASFFGRLDILVNNASTNVDGAPSDLEEATDDQVMERVNGKTLIAVRCSRAALPHMRRVRGGRIICIAGLSARSIGVGGTAPASARGATMASGIGNAALVNFAKHLSAAQVRSGILVNVILPVSVRTERFADRVARRAARDGMSLADAEAVLGGEVPLGRMIEASDIAPLVAFLVSPLAGAITGQSIAVDGGDSSTVVY